MHQRNQGMALKPMRFLHVVVAAIGLIDAIGRVVAAKAEYVDNGKSDVGFGNNAPSLDEERRLGRLSDFLSRFEMCEKTGTNVYRTVRANRLEAMRMSSDGSATRGACADCATLCSHEACKNDYVVSTDGGTESCTCLEDEPKKDMCGGHTTCANDVCSCLPGFEGDPIVGCLVQDACSLSPCGSGAICTNTGTGTHECSCPLGYGGDPAVACVDTDECITNTCGTNAKCVNLPGSYFCECMEGYEGDPTTDCVDIDECDDSTMCGENTVCLNDGGSFECKCLDGYEGDPKVGCTNINECRVIGRETLCPDPNSYCKDRLGSYECLCKDNFEKNPSTDKCVSTRSCWGDGEMCVFGSTCNKCCDPANYWWSLESYACGFNEPCLEDGKSCLPGVNCDLCCNTAYDGQGTICGGTCWEDEQSCGLGTTCDLCCEGFYWKEQNALACGKGECWEDGSKCSPVTGSCDQCCNLAFADGGRQCGGECWKDGRVCDEESNCELCCEFPSYWDSKNATACGSPPCLKDGVSCGDECYRCCNGAFNDGGETCGGECLKRGTVCEPFETCELCCGRFAYLPGNDTFVCGRGDGTCLEDGFDCGLYGLCDDCCNGPFLEDPNTCGGECLANGTICLNYTFSSRNHDDAFDECRMCCSGYHMKEEENELLGICGPEPCVEDGMACRPDADCYRCCNGNYLDGGFACGGKCLTNGTECVYGTSCHLCCVNEDDDDYYYFQYSYWYSKESLACGKEPCLEDGTDCIPGETCPLCCNRAIDDGGFKCGGECLEDGTACELFSTCEKCCTSYSYNETTEALECGYQNSTCLDDGESCVPRSYDDTSCYNCCNGAYDGNGTVCGGTCLKEGTECNYFSTCRLCCDYYMYDREKKIYECFDYGGDNYYDDYLY